MPFLQDTRQKIFQLPLKTKSGNNRPQGKM